MANLSEEYFVPLFRNLCEWHGLIEKVNRVPDVIDAWYEALSDLSDEEFYQAYLFGLTIGKFDFTAEALRASVKGSAESIALAQWSKAWEGARMGRRLNECGLDPSAKSVIVSLGGIAELSRMDDPFQVGTRQKLFIKSYQSEVLKRRTLNALPPAGDRPLISPTD